jgi:hypothetical protein
MQHKLQSILHALSIKYPDQKFIFQDKLDKQETLKLIHELEIKLNPLRYHLEQTFQHSYQALSDTGTKVGHDPKWEAKYLDLSIRITSEEQFDKFKHALTQSSYQDFLKIMQGATLHADQ